MALLLSMSGYDNQPWLKALAQWLPDEQVVTLNDHFAPEAIEFALVWAPPAGDLARYPNLRGIQILGVGTEHLDHDHSLPQVPVMRLIDPHVVADMGLYALYWTIHAQRHLGAYREQQARKLWSPMNAPTGDQFNVTVMGLGNMGRGIAYRLRDNGFRVCGWSLRATSLTDIPCYHGRAQLPNALGQANVVILCLPLLDSTRDILNAETLAWLPVGAFLINVGRGATLTEADCLAALDNGRLSGMALDVFAQEPLPAASPLWSHPKVYITPHIAGTLCAQSATRLIAENLYAVRRGETPRHVYMPLCHRNRQV